MHGLITQVIASQEALEIAFYLFVFGIGYGFLCLIWQCHKKTCKTCGVLFACQDCSRKLDDYYEELRRKDK